MTNLKSEIVGDISDTWNWTVVTLNPNVVKTNVIEGKIREWCFKNLKKDDFSGSYIYWIFRNKKDAMMFILRWL
jgi:hypothetical protein